jgi:hypothetical protein
VAWLLDESRRLTALIPQRWPYAPGGATIRVVGPERFAGSWGGKWDFDARLAYINASLTEPLREAACAHELSHGRFSTRLPEMPGEEGSALLVVEMFDELRVEAFAIAAHRPARDDFRAWLRADMPDTIEIPNVRGAALAYGMLAGQVIVGACTDVEMAGLVTAFRDQHGQDWVDALDARLTEAMHVPPGGTGTLMTLARSWDDYVTS